jgi:CRP-like cAMP-binding protein
MMPTEMKTLKSIPLFNHLSSEELEILGPIVHQVMVNEGEMLTRRGMAAHTFYILVSGNVMVSYKDDRALSLHDKGDMVGLSVGIVPSVYKGTAVALTDGEFLSISRQDLVDLIHGHNEMGDKILKQMNTVSVERAAIVDGEAKENQGGIH